MENCNHNNLTALLLNVKAQLRDDKSMELKVSPVPQDWMMFFDEPIGNIQFAMGRAYRCKDCGKKIIIQSMYQLPEAK